MPNGQKKSSGLLNKIFTDKKPDGSLPEQWSPHRQEPLALFNNATSRACALGVGLPDPQSRYLRYPLISVMHPALAHQIQHIRVHESLKHRPPSLLIGNMFHQEMT
jgi:hypothetical protein